jgi:hypothetical protein
MGLMETFGRLPKTKEEKELAEMAYKEGMKNNWCNGEYARLDGDFIVEEDRLNRNSFTVIEDIEKLKRFFMHSNWCLGQGVIFKSLVFINQVDAGDEWLTMKRFDSKVVSFESITFSPMCSNYEGYAGREKEQKAGECFERYMARLLKARLVEGKVKY